MSDPASEDRAAAVSAADAAAKSSLDAYQATINRLEPKLHMIDSDTGWASIAISMKRIADSLEELLIAVRQGDQE